MKKMPKEEQMKKNGGYYWHCHICNKNYVAVNKDSARKNAYKHIANMNHTGTAIWDYGLIEECRYN